MKLVEAGSSPTAGIARSESDESIVPFPQNHLFDVPLTAQVLLGQVSGRLGDLASISVGDVIASNRMISDRLDLYVNGVRLASGEIIHSEGMRCLRIKKMAMEA
jgi:flagellar motor switch/type III secretory pathway protein FliN